MEQNEPRDTQPIDVPGPVPPGGASRSSAAGDDLPTEPVAAPQAESSAPDAAISGWALPSPANQGPSAAGDHGPAARRTDATPPAPGAAGPAPVPAAPDAPSGTPTFGSGSPTAAQPSPASAASPGAVPVYRRRLVLGLGGAAAAILLVGAGFLAGQSFHRGDETSLVSSSGPRQAAPGAEGFPGGPGGPGSGAADGEGYGQPGDHDGDGGQSLGGVERGVVVGRVTAVSGSTLTLTGSDGATVKVTTTSSTAVGGKTGGSLSGIGVGETVLVRGTRAADGSVTATAIMAAPGRGERAGHGSGQSGRSSFGQDGQARQGSAAGGDAALGAPDTSGITAA